MGGQGSASGLRSVASSCVVRSDVLTDVQSDDTGPGEYLLNQAWAEGLEEHELLTMPEIAAALEIPYAVVYGWYRRGSLQPRYVGDKGNALFNLTQAHALRVAAKVRAQITGQLAAGWTRPNAGGPLVFDNEAATPQDDRSG